MQSPGNMKGHGSMFDILEHGNGLPMGHPLQHLAVDGQNLIS